MNIGGRIKPGGYVLFSDEQFHPKGSLVRIISVKDFCNNPHSPTIELSNAPVSSSFQSSMNKVEETEVVIDNKHREAIQYTKRRFRDSQETIEMLKDAMLENFTDAISPIAVQTMEMLIGDESLQFRFVSDKTNPQPVVHNVAYNQATKVLTVPAGIIQHMTLGIKTMSSSHKPGEYKFWSIPAFETPPLTDGDKKYYLYAKVSKTDQTGVFYISEQAIAMEGVAGYYHLLMGVLNSEYDGERSYVSLYGFSEILPGRITTDKIVSSDGKTYFDLLLGEIGGRINFIDGLLSGLVGIGNNNGVNAGLNGVGTSDKDVRIWAGASEAQKNTSPFRVLHDGTMYASKGVFAGYLQTPFISLEDSDAVWNTTRHVFQIKENLNIVSSGIVDTYHSYEDWIELPFDEKYIGARITILNNRFPPYTRTPASFAKTVLLVSAASKSSYIGIGGRPKSGTTDEVDPYAIVVFARVVELLCVPYSTGKPHWIVLNWGDDILEKTWQ